MTATDNLLDRLSKDFTPSLSASTLGTYFRSYPMDVHANKAKLDEIHEVIEEYRKTAHEMSKFQWLDFHKNKAKIKDQKDVKHVESRLSARYKQTCLTQVTGILKSFLANLQNEFVWIVYGSSIPEDERKFYFSINKRQLWFHNEVRMGDTPIPSYIVLNARKIMKRVMRRHELPTFNNINMVLDAKVGKIEEKHEAGATGFDYWVTIATLKSGKPVCIPMNSYEYFDSFDGVLKNCVQVNKDNRDWSLSFRFVKELNVVELEKACDTLGIDIGLKVFIATNYGDLLGTNMMEYLVKYDNIINRLFRNLRKQGIKPSENKRYVKLVTRVRRYIKNEVNRLVNKLIEQYSPREIKTEKLDFSGSNLGHRTNRLLNNFGLGEFKSAVNQKCEKHNIRHTEVHPAYTSRSCPNCKYTDKKNRVSRDRFVCQHCGYSRHADVIGGKNVSVRSSATLSQNRKDILRKLNEEHDLWKAKRGSSPATGSGVGRCPQLNSPN